MLTHINQPSAQQGLLKAPPQAAPSSPVPHASPPSLYCPSPQPDVAPDVQFLLARAGTLQQAAGDKAVSLEHLAAAIEGTPAAKHLASAVAAVAGAGGQPAPKPQPAG